MIYMNVMQDASEVVEYNCGHIPFYVHDNDIADYPDRKALCHWHKDIEIIYITEGKMNYHVNGKTIPLKEQSCVIINSQHLHYGSSRHDQNCKFICIRFQPGILNEGSTMYKKFVTPLIENSEIEYLCYDIDSPNHRRIVESIHHLDCIKKKMKDGDELRLISETYLLWQILFEECKPKLRQEAMVEPTDLVLQKKMVSYIHEHYQDALTLDEIAASANISRSKCCKIFKQYLHQSPVDFLNKYRLEVSRRLLTGSQDKVTQIAFSCGFNHLSYFSKIFINEYGCTPTEYRRKNAVASG